MHYSKHRLTASVAYVTTLMYASTNEQWALHACPLVSSSKTKPCQFISVQLSNALVRKHQTFNQRSNY